MNRWSPTTLVLIDEATDRERASDGHSRYGAYLRQHPGDLRDWLDEDTPHLTPDAFAAAAWRIATSPIMSPGYALTRPDLSSITASLTTDGFLAVDVTVPLHHRHLAHSVGRGVRDWQIDRAYWAASTGGVDYRPRHVPESGTAVLTSTVVHLHGHGWDLPRQSATTGPTLVREAKQAVRVIADRVNAEAGPLVAELLGEVQ